MDGIKKKSPADSPFDPPAKDEANVWDELARKTHDLRRQLIDYGPVKGSADSWMA